jgi:cell division protein FtsI (penicillin-binding protein 3)
LDKALRSDRREYLVGGLTPEQRAVVHNLGLPGVVFEEESRRVYPLGSTAAHIIGFSDRGGAGIAGSELALDDTVRKLAAVPGQSVPLSIDLRVQTALEDELQKNAVSFQATGAVGLVTNVRTGEILALASYPDFNPNRPGLTPPNNLLNRAAASVFEMGSIFKVFTVAMGLDTGRVNLSTTFDATTPITVGGQTIHDFHAEKRVMTLSDIFLHSSNIGTAKLALTIGGPTMERYFQSFGLFAPAKIELAETTHPILPHRWSENIVASASFGHAMSVSPLAVASGMGAILNGGNLVPLTIRKVEAGAVPAGKRVISEATSRSMLDLMRLNVTHGTGASAERAAPGLRVGGKTGSAEKVVAGRYDRSKLVSSFAAVFPTDGPIDSDRYFILILVDEPKGNKESYGFATGGWTAAPAVGRVAERIAPYLGVRRMETATDAPAVTPERLSGGDR